MSELVTNVVPAPLRPTHTGATVVAATCAAAAVLARNGVSGWSVVEAATAVVLIWLAAIDLETRLLPNRVTLPATGVLLVASLGLGPTTFLEHTLSAVVAGGFLFAAAAIRPGDLGMGDAKLALLLGALLGTAVLTALVIGFCLVAAAGLVLLAMHGRAGLKRHLPLGPFLAAGALAVLLLG